MTPEDHLRAAVFEYFRKGHRIGEARIAACGITECVLLLLQSDDLPALRELFKRACELSGCVAKVETLR